MASRSHTTFNKRQKELARQQKQRDKAARKLQRKAEKAAGGTGLESAALLESEPGLESGLDAAAENPPPAEDRR